MKNVYTIIVVLACSFFLPVMAQTASSGTINYQTFYNDLSPYETWINYPGVGEVWHPDVGSDFRPYATNGYWENTDQGWYWDSNYDWGWAPFHYGNWFYDNQYGWLWEPGYEWSPAWVTWGDMDDYYTWAPIASASIIADNRTHDYYWNMVEKNNIYDKDLSRHLASENLVRSNADRITLLNNTYSNLNGPAHEEVEWHVGQSVPTRSLQEVTQPVLRNNNIVNQRIDDENRLSVYRPEVQIDPSVNYQPVQSRQAAVEHINPIRDNSNWPSASNIDHNINIENLPMREPSIYEPSMNAPAIHEPSMDAPSMHPRGGRR